MASKVTKPWYMYVLQQFHTHTHWQDITSWYHMVTHCYPAAWSPTWAFPLPGIHWGKQASVTQCEYTAAIVCPALWCQSPSEPLHFKHWQPVGGYVAEEARVRGQNSGLCHRLVTNTHANYKLTIHRGVQSIHYHVVHIVMTALNICAKCNTYAVLDTSTQVHTHSWGQCGAMAPVLRDMVLICGMCIFRDDCSMPRKCA